MTIGLMDVIQALVAKLRSFPSRPSVDDRKALNE
jgi:hypothetical protein